MFTCSDPGPVSSVDSNYLVLKKTDVESIFNILQNSEENKILLYVGILKFTLAVLLFA